MLDQDLSRRTALSLFLGAGAALATGTSAFAALGSTTPDPRRLLFHDGADQLFTYANMEKMYATRPFKRGSHVMPLSPGSAPSIRFRHADREWDINSFMAHNRVSGLVAVKGGKIILEEYRLGNNRNTRWTSFSMAKSLTSTLVGAAIKDGDIGAVTDPVTRYLPSLKGTAYDGTIIRDLLRMSSGVRWNEDYLDPASDVNFLVDASAKRATRGTFFKHMAGLPRAHPPGTVFNYSTGETCVLGEIVSAAIGGPLSPYVTERIWKPVGMESDGFWILIGDNDIEMGGGCFSATSRDYARLGMFMLADGVANGRRILPEGWVQEASQASAPGGTDGKPTPYGYQWWTNSSGYLAGGVFGQYIYINKAADLVVTLQSAWPKPGVSANEALTDAFYEAVLKATS